MSLEEQLKKEIYDNGPMSVESFMGRAVHHYYSNNKVFGSSGDFITAPDISQMFGELIGLWLADCWIQLGGPKSFYLIECGPGKGTLMSDLLRAASGVDGFTQAARIVLIEMSESLRQEQRGLLKDYEVSWSESIQNLDIDAPVFVIGNEFLDALPVRQYQFHEGKWQERVVGVDDQGMLCFGLSDTHYQGPSGVKEGSIIEVSRAQQEFAAYVSSLISAHNGTALFIDYGYSEGYGDSLQAIKKHKYADILKDVGQADLTCHVNFSSIKEQAGNCDVYGPVTQAHFLKSLGISQRAAMLKKNVSSDVCNTIDSAHNRLVSDKEMGSLFKVIAFCSEQIKPAGF